ncbi:MAG TPA: deoxyribodipyrimidine photo-lyase [Puia sp.]|nr:deoxyribodipyrimidine photo-lyase [Puia sp.]
MKQKLSVFWFRRDLRLEDNAGLYQALKGPDPVLPLFIFDRNILDKLEDKADRRVEFIHAALEEMQADLHKMGSSLEVYYDLPENVWRHLLSEYQITQVFANHDYEPYAIDRDEAVTKLLEKRGIPFHSFKDQVIFEKNEILKDDGKPYTIFTPYGKKWRAALDDFYLSSYPVKRYFSGFFRQASHSLPSLSSMGFKPVDKPFPSGMLKEEILKKYRQQRDYPALAGTSRLGIHLRFGTCSIRTLARKASELSDSFLNELIWRDFYQMILWHFPWVGRGKSFKPAYDHIPWRDNEEEFEKWCKGQTGYPIVDAGMRELNETGFMHNRVRMIVASFLAKHLLIDWRWGEAWFAEKLLDFDLAANNGGWQWAAGSGCDAAPYFRVFNPALQTKRFDPKMKYISRWVPEYAESGYPAPIVDHEFARRRALEVYGDALKAARG